MLSRALFAADGSVRRRRMIPTVVGLVVMALLGGLIAALAPVAAGAPGLVLALVSVGIAAKIPLIAFIAWIMVRNDEWPSRPPRWSRAEVGEITRYIRGEAARVRSRPDAAERLAYLRDEAWHVADRASDADTPEAVAVALEIQAWIEGVATASSAAQERSA